MVGDVVFQSKILLQDQLGAMAVLYHRYLRDNSFAVQIQNVRVNFQVISGLAQRDISLEMSVSRLWVS